MNVTRNCFFLAAFLVFLTSALAACAGPFFLPPATPTQAVKPMPTATPTRTIPQVIEHARPQPTPDTAWLGAGGCIVTYGSPFLSQWDCSRNSALAGLDCTYVQASDLYGAFGPGRQIYACVKSVSFGRQQELQPKGDLFRYGGCMQLTLTTFMVQENDSVHPIRNLDELRSLVVPISSPDAALTYALMVTNLREWYPTASSLRERYALPYHFLVPVVNATHVDTVPDGFLVHLYSGPVPQCGCGARTDSAGDVLVHTESAVDVLVRPDGTFERSQPQPVLDWQGCID